MSDSYYTTENQLHTAVAMFLDAALPDDAVWQHSMNEGKRGWKYQTKVKQHGVKPGWPDIQVIWRGRSIFLELKRPKRPGKPAGRLTQAQKDMHTRLKLSGCVVGVCHSLSEVQEFLAPLIPLRAREAA